MKSDKDRELWLLEMSNQQPARRTTPDEGTSTLEASLAGSQKLTVLAAIAAIGVTAASLATGS